MDPAALSRTPLSTIPMAMVTSAFELPGFRVTRNLGIVRGIVVRSRSIVGTFFASFQTLFGGNITLYSDLCEKARGDAYHLMIEQAANLGANAIIGMRYDANEVTAGVTEVLAYGTAVLVVPRPSVQEPCLERDRPLAVHRPA